MRPTPSKKFSASTGTKLKGYSPGKPESKNRLLSPEPGPDHDHKKRFSVNIDPASLKSLQALAGKKKLYLSQATYNKEYPDYPDCVSSKKPYGVVKAYSMNSYRGIERMYNEDRIVSVINVPRPQEFKDKIWPKVSYFGIFDGHAGDSCANFLQKNLLNYIIKHKSFLISPKEALKGAFEKAEAEFKALAIEKPDGHFKVVDDSGSCAIVCLFVDSCCYIANVGDSRAILSIEGGKRVKQITVDHKPNNPQEKKRIISKGGKVVKDEVEKETEINEETGEVMVVEGSCSSDDEERHEIYRVEPGKLAVSRSIGDFSVKSKETGGLPDIVIPTPDIYQVDLISVDDFILMGCDGIFDVLDSEDAIQAAWYAENFCKGINGDLNLKCSIFVNNVIKCAMVEDSTDNLSCIIIALGNLEKITKNKFLREKVHSAIKANDSKK